MSGRPVLRLLVFQLSLILCKVSVNDRAKLQQNKTLYWALKWQQWCLLGTINLTGSLQRILGCVPLILFLVSKASYLHAPLVEKSSWYTLAAGLGYGKDCQNNSYFFAVRFLGIFVLVCVFIYLFVCLSTLNVLNICWDQLYLIQFCQSLYVFFFSYCRFLDRWRIQCSSFCSTEPKTIEKTKNCTYKKRNSRSRMRNQERKRKRNQNMYAQLPCEFEEIYFFSTEMNWPASDW